MYIPAIEWHNVTITTVVRTEATPQRETAIVIIKKPLFINNCLFIAEYKATQSLSICMYQNLVVPKTGS